MCCAVQWHVVCPRLVCQRLLAHVTVVPCLVSCTTSCFCFFRCLLVNVCGAPVLNSTHSLALLVQILAFFLHCYFFFFFHFVERNTTARRQSRLFESGALLTRALCEQGPAFLSRCAVLSTGLPVVEGQDLERGGPASAGEVERAAGNRGAAGLHSAPTRHWYADALCCSLSFCLSVRASSSEVGGAPAAVRVWMSCVRVCEFVCVVMCDVSEASGKQKDYIRGKLKMLGQRKYNILRNCIATILKNKNGKYHVITQKFLIFTW